jgi:hypothetical protein
MQLEGGYRYYQTARLRLGVLLIYAYAALGVAATVLATAFDSHAFPVSVAAIGAAALVAVLIWGERVLTKTGLEECSQGFVDHTNLGSRLLLLQDIEHFDHRRVLSVDRVYAVRAPGNRGDPIQGLIQGRRIIWDGGETCDIVKELNARLDARRDLDWVSRRPD